MIELPEFYKTYGETLATRLRAIAHGKAGPTFVFVEDVGDAQEVLGFLNAGKVPEGASILVWENYEEDLDSGGRDNYHSVIVGSLAVIKKAKNRNEISAAHAICRRAALDVLALMMQDAELEQGALNEQTIQVEVRRIPASKIKALATVYYGYAFEFIWTVPLDLSLSQDALF